MKSGFHPLSTEACSFLATVLLRGRLSFVQFKSHEFHPENISGSVNIRRTNRSRNRPLPCENWQSMRRRFSLNGITRYCSLEWRCRKSTNIKDDCRNTKIQMIACPHFWKQMIICYETETIRSASIFGELDSWPPESIVTSTKNRFRTEKSNTGKNCIVPFPEIEHFRSQRCERNRSASKGNNHLLFTIGLSISCFAWPNLK